MTKPEYKTLLDTKDLRTIYNSVWNNRQEIRDNLDDDMWCNDMYWSVVEYFIDDLEKVAEYLEANK